MKKAQSILILGGAGGLSQLLVRKLVAKSDPLKITVVDNRNLSSNFVHKDVQFKRIRYTRNSIEELFRNQSFDVVYHLARSSHARSFASQSLAQRLQVNVIGTMKILELCLEHGVQKIILLSTFHVYGALPDNPIYLTESDPLRASLKNPEVRDVVEMDHIATNWMWKNQKEIKMVVLRPTNIIGPSLRNGICQYLINSWSPTPIDYNPTFQFIHALDMAKVLEHCLGHLDQGIFNIAPSGLLKLKEARKLVGKEGVPFPLSLVGGLAKFLGQYGSPFPHYLLDYLKFSSLLDTSAITNQLGEDFFQFDSREAIEQLRLI